MVGIRSIPLALLILALLPASAAATPTKQIIIKREPGLSSAERADIRADADVRFVRDLNLPRTEVVTAPASQTREALEELRADDDVAYAEVDHQRRAFAADPFMSSLWALRNTGQTIVGELQGVDDADSDVVEAWELFANPPGGGQTVAVVDSGIDADHEDLVDRVGVQQNFVGPNGPGGDDGNGHGTHVSGTIAATRDNGVGIAGVAPNAEVMALRALDDEGAGYDSDIAEAFVFAGENDVRVVNASFGGPAGGETLRAAIAAYPSTLFVVAAGNGGADGVGDNNDSAPQYPCNVAERNVLCVGASTNQDGRAAFSNFGAVTVDVFAPGQGIASTIAGAELPHKYAFSDGTSMATPHVAAAAALVLQTEPTLSAGDLKDILLASADAGNAFSGRSLSGGRLNVRAAVELAQVGTSLPDRDGDGFPDAADACATSAASTSADGCPDADEDAVADGVDNCPSTFNPGQQNRDGRADGGDACDQDHDDDGRPNAADACPTVYGTLANGCPAPPPPPPPPADRDGDGRIDAADACPDEPAATGNGCPIAQITGVSTPVGKRGTRRWVTVTVSTDRAATVRLLVQRKRGRRWARVTSKTIVTSGNRARLRASGLRLGAHRVKVSISSSGGAGAGRTKSFRVR